MDQDRFDRIAKTMAAPGPRRRVLGGLAAAALGARLGLGAGEGAGATHGGCRHNEERCTRAGQCCSGRCANERCKPCAGAAQCPPPANPCQRAVCTAKGRCAVRACGTDQVCCGGACTALGTDDDCGTCGDTCTADQTCRGDACDGGCLALQADCAGAEQCCRDLDCGPINNPSQDQCCRPLGGACSNPGGFGECCAAVLAPGSANLVICAPDNTCGGPGAGCSVAEGCASGVCCATGCCAAGQRCRLGQCTG